MARIHVQDNARAAKITGITGLRVRIGQTQTRITEQMIKNILKRKKIYISLKEDMPVCFSDIHQMYVRKFVLSLSHNIRRFLY